MPLFVDVVVVKMSVRSHSLFIPQTGDVCWVEIPATDMSRGQAFYKTVFGWEFASPPSMPEGTYAMFSKPGTKLAGGMYPIKEGDLIQPKVNSEGKGQATNRIITRVEEVDDALKRIEAAGGAIISYVLCVMTCGQFD
jgi:predicted enzyme related to lactoylglutathione lyase